MERNIIHVYFFLLITGLDIFFKPQKNHYREVDFLLTLARLFYVV